MMKLSSKILTNERGAMGWALLWFIRDTYTDITGAVPGSWLHIDRTGGADCRR